MKPIDAPSVQPRPLSRRRFLLNGATLGALLAPGILGLAITPSGTAGGASMDMNGRGVPRAPFDKGAALVEPEVRRSANGELRTSLRVAYAYKDMGGYRLSLRTYEGNLPGPTLRLRPGDVLRIRLTNDLPPNPDPVPLDMALPHHFNTTNFHSHGLHVSPGGISDNIFRSMEPGRGLRHRDRHPGRSPAGDLLVSPPSPRQRRCSDDERHGRRPDRRGRFRRRP